MSFRIDVNREHLRKTIVGLNPSHDGGGGAEPTPTHVFRE